MSTFTNALKGEPSSIHISPKFSCALIEEQATPPKKDNHLLSGTEKSTHHKTIDGKIYKKSIWTKEQDELLQEVVKAKGIGLWKDISAMIPNRSGKQCRQRWHNHLRQGVTKQSWTPEQFWILALCVRAFGTKWSIISRFLPTRSDNTIKNQWNCKMKPYKQKFNTEIDKLLLNQSSWNTLQKNEQNLLSIISKNSNGKIQYVDLEILNSADDLVDKQRREGADVHQTMALYQNQLAESLKDFQILCYELAHPRQYVEFELNDDQSPEQIVGGQIIFEEPEDFF